jgi:hypothetical protein
MTFKRIFPSPQAAAFDSTPHSLETEQTRPERKSEKENKKELRKEISLF